jgi:hypothetical protein
MILDPPFQVLYLEWDDAAHFEGWHSRERLDLFREDQHLVRQFGILVSETPRELVLAAMWGPENATEEEMFGDLMRIPKGWIRKRLVLGSLSDEGFKMRGKKR